MARRDVETLRPRHSAAIVMLLLRVTHLSSRALAWMPPLRCTRAVSISSCRASPDASQDEAVEGAITTVVGGKVWETEETIKKSKFIGKAAHAASFAEADSFLAEVVKEHPKARHWCWAWKGLDETHRFYDDGEPGGTAGQPIFAAIEGAGLSEVMVVVVRYSGGIKLGTGGLVRAYGGAASQVLKDAEEEVRLPMTTLRISAPMNMVGGVYNSISQCTRLDEYFTADSVVITVSMEASALSKLLENVQDSTKGQAVCTVVDDE